MGHTKLVPNAKQQSHMILNFVFGLLLKGDMLFFRNQLWMCESFSAAYGTFQADEDVILHWQVPYTRTKSTWLVIGCACLVIHLEILQKVPRNEPTEGLHRLMFYINNYNESGDGGRS
ncbi:hypothetical protein OUZ56_023006 [Daphnia magna]|uniref:Uncharacterized protein n=1 Tax=Daphnia magna TaxID=35525 RepID=A0ABR0AY35_9CRUS|nr:hypothetical protein OUZ56_023006 [Daphnia magna]